MFHFGKKKTKNVSFSKTTKMCHFEKIMTKNVTFWKKNTKNVSFSKTTNVSFFWGKDAKKFHLERNPLKITHFK